MDILNSVEIHYPLYIARSLLLFIGLFYFWKNGFSKEKPTPLGLLTVGAALVFFFFVYPLGFIQGWLIITWADNGLEPEFRTWLPFMGIFFLVSTLCGTEVVFRKIPWDRLPNTPPSQLILIQAAFYAVWIAAESFTYLSIGETIDTIVFIISAYLQAIVAGVLYATYRNIWLSGIWTTATSFFSYVLISNYDMALPTMGYYVSSTPLLPFVFLAPYALIFLLFYFFVTRRRLT